MEVLFDHISVEEVCQTYFLNQEDSILIIDRGLEYFQLLRVISNGMPFYIVEERLISEKSMVKHFRLGLKPLSSENNYLNTSVGEIHVKTSEILPEEAAKQAVSFYLSNQNLRERFNYRNISREVGMVEKGNGIKLNEYLMNGK